MEFTHTDVGVDLASNKPKFQKVRLLPVEPPRESRLTDLFIREKIPLDDLWVEIGKPIRYSNKEGSREIEKTKALRNVKICEDGTELMFSLNVIIFSLDKSSQLGVDAKNVELLNDFRNDVTFYNVYLQKTRRRR